MFARFSTAFCVLLGLTSLVDINAGIVPGNYAELVTRDLDLDKRAGVVGVINNAEPDPDD
ncbi:uncharacterized protein EDB91DRAFT_1251201 [Suillus paluster]|uniref:uncharacterized protein n=1 Tax=Suillus paluster TaxID=48578 RepID=UPI001B8730CF|nr:uncharacterized protein EDB91DRAFT_1251201 [Suillus paluster]KAG1733896.1 hypothetical protein EDB91DRAFT_1251201 [Suillus paluster]